MGGGSQRCCKFCIKGKLVSASYVQDCRNIYGLTELYKQCTVMLVRKTFNGPFAL